MMAIEIDKAKDRIVEAARLIKSTLTGSTKELELGECVAIRKTSVRDLQTAISELDDLQKKQSIEVEDLAKIMGVDLNSESLETKEYPIPNYKDIATKFIFSKEFKEKGVLIRKFLGEGLPLPEESILIVGKNRIGKTPVLKYWKEYLENKIMDVEREELIGTDKTNSYVRLDKERKQYSSLYKTELELYEKFDSGESIDYSNRSGYLFLDDIFQESIWKDSTNFKHKRFITFMTKFYEDLRDNYSGNLIVIATTNHLPTSDTLDNDTRIQSRVIGTFKRIINIEDSK